MSNSIPPDESPLPLVPLEEKARTKCIHERELLLHGALSEVLGQVLVKITNSCITSSDFGYFKFEGEKVARRRLTYTARIDSRIMLPSESIKQILALKQFGFDFDGVASRRDQLELDFYDDRYDYRPIMGGIEY